jgi:hypothetical protein
MVNLQIALLGAPSQHFSRQGIMAIGPYGWTGQQPGSGFFDRPPAALGVFASSDRL